MPRNVQFHLPIEPDGENLVCWLQFTEPSTFEKDSSGFNNVAVPRGRIIYKTGKIDMAPYFDGIDNFVEVEHFTGINDITDFKKSMCFMCWVKPQDLTLSGPNDELYRTVFSKADNANNKYHLVIKDDGAANFTLTRAGNAIFAESPPGSVPLNQWTFIVCQFTSYASYTSKSYTEKSFTHPFSFGNIAQIWINGVQYGQAQGYPLVSQLNDHTKSIDLCIGANHWSKIHRTRAGHFIGLIDDFRIWRDRIITHDEVQNQWINKYSISEIAAGEVPVLGRTWCFPKVPSYTTKFSAKFNSQGSRLVGESTVDEFGIKKIYPTKFGTSSWAAVLWSNGTSRTIGNTTNCETDPYDSRLSVTDVGNPKVTIDGAGIMKSGTITGTSGSPRVRVSEAWQNVESTVYLKTPSSTPDGHCQIRMKTDHWCPNSNTLFGGYIVFIDFDDQAVYFKKEKTHDVGYSARKNQVAATLNLNTWYGFKGVCYNVGGNVKLECWMDTTGGGSGGTWVKITEGTDDGTWIGTQDQQTCFGSAVRTDNNVVNGFIEYKRWTIREIVPPI